MTYTGEQIKAAIDAWAEAQVDENIADQCKSNAEYNEMYGGRHSYRTGGKIPWPTSPEEFNREQVRDSLAEDFYQEMPSEGIELPGLGLAKLVDSYGGEGQGEEWWRVYQIGDEFYKADHYYSSYETEPWHSDCTIFRVVPREVTLTQWFAE